MTNPYLQQLGAVGVLGFVLVLVIRWMLTSLTRELREVGNAIRTLSLVQLDMHKTLIIHDAQIRGINPTAGATDTDAHVRAREEYNKILSTLDSTSTAIKNFPST